MAGIDLKKEWAHLLTMSGIPSSVGPHEFVNICHAYSEPHRHYHTLKHIEHMLITLREAGFDSPAGLWAVWYHDYIYNPGKSGNEAESAEQAEKAMKELGVEQSIINAAIEIILATKDHKAEAASDELLTILDADMAILGVEPTQYDAYRMQVQGEFRGVPEMLFRSGRIKFLESVLRQSKIYKTDWFAERFEVRARQNMRDEINCLAAF